MPRKKITKLFTPARKSGPGVAALLRQSVAKNNDPDMTLDDGQIIGKVLGHRDGFGFLQPDNETADVFLPDREMQKVMHGDRVLVNIIGTDKRGRPEGKIAEVLERANRRLVGRLLIELGVTTVVPEDQRIKHDILIAPADTMKAKSGQVVMVELTAPPSGYSQPQGRVVEVLGDIDDPGMEIEIAVRKFDVPHEFSKAAEDQAQALPNALKAADLKHRVDLCDVPFITIDGEDARDFDDAVYCEPIAVQESGAKRRKKAKESEETGEAILLDGGWRLLVAIADVSHYVSPGCPLDVDAQDRSTSVYFPRRVIPMLPEKLSNGLCSLKPQVDRLALVCDMVVTAQGEVKAYQFYPAVIHSAARTTYNQVWGMLSCGDLSALKQFAHVKPQVDHLYDVFKVLLAKRNQRGAMDFDTVETKIVCDVSGRIEKIVPTVRNDAHKLIEECMLAANVCAADFIMRSQHLALYRVHEGPTDEKLDRLHQFLKTLGLSLSGGEKPTPRDYAKLAPQIKDRPDANLIQTMMLRSMQQAVYSPLNEGHFGLAYEAYTHFTSPIRRYPDLLVHRVIKALLEKKRYHPKALAAPARIVSRGPKKGKSKPKDEVWIDAQAHDPKDLEQWGQLGQTCSAHERRADEASRDVEAWLKCQYMRNRIGEVYRGQITGVASFGLFVTLDELYVEGMVHITELGPEYFHFNEAIHELRGERTGQRYRLTDPIDVQLSRVDLEARRIEFRLLSKAERDAANGFPLQRSKPAEPAAEVDDVLNRLPGKGFDKKSKAGKEKRPLSNLRGASKKARLR